MTVDNAIVKAVRAIRNVPKARTATVFVSDKLTVRATRRSYKGKVQKGDRLYDISLTIGRPNYDARELQKRMKRLGVPVPAGYRLLRLGK